MFRGAGSFPTAEPLPRDCGHPMKSRLLAGLSLLLAACATQDSTPDAGPVMFPPPPDPPRILFLRGVSSGLDVQPKESSWLANAVVGEEVVDEKPMMKPCAIGFRDGIFYISDTQVGCIYKLDLAKKQAGQVELKGRAVLTNPTGMCFTEDGFVYIADRGRRQVVVLDKNFQWVKEIGPWDAKSAPTDVAVRKDRVYVTDVGSLTVRVLDRKTDQQVQTLGKLDSEDEFMRGPSNLDVDDNGYVYVVDTVFSRIYVWDADGNFVCHVGKAGDVPGHLARPKGITIYDRKIWILDSAFDNCQILDLEGHAMLFFGGQGEAPGSMSFPRKVWVGDQGLDLFKDELAKAPEFTPERLVVVTNTWGSKVNFYALGKSNKFKYNDPPLAERPKKPEPEPEQPAATPEKPAEVKGK